MEEHRAMVECQHTEGDRLYFVCLFCGRLSLPDPSWLVVSVAVVFFFVHIAWWIAL